jgi:hypothetical protein
LASSRKCSLIACTSDMGLPRPPRDPPFEARRRKYNAAKTLEETV